MPPVRTVKQETDVAVPRAGETYVADDGTVSQVLDDHIDANYEPTEDEVLEFADWIGIKLPQESELLWLAREGLKTPLPKEWKPCSTNDGEVYYFNFKTGDSSWDHPMDGIFRQRLEQERGKVQARKTATTATNSTTTSSATGTATTANRSTATAPSSSRPAMQQMHVMMTDMGVLRRDGGPGSAPERGPTAAAAGVTAKGAGTTGRPRDDDDKAIMHYPPQQQQATPAAATSATAARTSGGALAAPRAGAVAETPSPAPHRIVSEAERALEERVQREAQQALERELSKVQDAHHATMATLQGNYDRDMAELRSADAARRATSTQQEEEERDRRLQQTRASCEETYGDELRSLEREAEAHATRLQRLEAEAARVTSGNTQRAAIEAELKAALASQRAAVEESAARQHEAAVAAAQSDHAAAMQRIRDEEQDGVKAAQQTRQRKFDVEERSMALQTEAQRRKLAEQLKELEAKLASAAAQVVAAAAASTAAPATTTAASRMAGSESAASTLSARLERVAGAKAARLREVEAAAAQEQAAARSGGEAALAELAHQLQTAQQALRSPLTAVTSPGPLSRMTSFSSDRPATVTVQSAARPTSATLSVAFTQELNRIRLLRGKERQERLAALRVDREAALSAAAAAAAAKSGPSGAASDAAAGTTAGELRAAHAAELEATKALYATMEAELKEQHAREAAEAAVATTEAQQSALVAKAVDAEVALYIAEAEARYDRLRTEAAAKREKALVDHRLAMEAYERRKREVEARASREQQEAQEAYVQSRLDAAVAAEKTRLAADQAVVLSRLSARYDEEREAVKAEVEEEMCAYEVAEQQKCKAAAIAAAAAAAAVEKKEEGESQLAASPPAVVPAERLAALAKERDDRQAESAARTRAQAVQRAALEERAAALQTQERQARLRLKSLTEEIAGLVAAGQPPPPSASSTHTPPPPPPSSSSASPAPPLAASMGGRLRSMHEATLQTLEQGYRAQETALEAELLMWRNKARALQSSRVPTGLNTPQQQVLGDATRAGGVAAFAGTAAPRAASTASLLYHQPSPIPAAAAGVSLQCTPTLPGPFDDSPWRPTGAAPPTLTMQPAGPPAPGLVAALGTGAPASTAAALLSCEQQQRALQERRASLQAAREAWQKNRRRETEQYPHYPHTSASSAAAAPYGDSDARSVLDVDGRSREEHLHLALSHLSERLDALTGEAVERQRHELLLHSRPHPQRRGQSALRTAAASSPSLARAHSARNRDLRDAHGSGDGAATAHGRGAPHSAYLSTATPPRGMTPTSHPELSKASRQRPLSSRSGVGGGEASSESLASKWDSLLLDHHHHRHRRR
ncbi:WW domain containing protein [Novymonas esmeraldas]|uniref:WW domain containing protein n=1 Tax=Novymonas esmeraldas TaxID=1808958 RepID=A0AAW0EQB3_9TRYP